MILVLATPRSGSSWFTSNYLTSIHKDHVAVGEPFNSYHNSLQEQLVSLDTYANSSVIIKLFPQHIKDSLPGIYKKLSNAAEKIYILARKNYNAQLRSLYVAEQTEYFYSASLPERNIQYHQDLYNLEDRLLKNSYYFLQQAYRDLKNAQLVFLEDLPATGKYNQPVVWDVEPPVIDFDTAQIFKESK